MVNEVKIKNNIQVKLVVSIIFFFLLIPLDAFGKTAHLTTTLKDRSNIQVSKVMNKGSFVSLIESSIRKNNYEALTFLLKYKGITVFYPYLGDYTILQKIITQGNLSFIKKTLQDIPDINQALVGDYGSILDYVQDFKAIFKEKKRQKILKLLKDKGAVSLLKPYQAFTEAILKEDTQKINAFIKQGYSLEQAYHFMSATHGQKTNFLRLMLKYGLDLKKVEFLYLPLLPKQRFKDVKKYYDQMITKDNVNQRSYLGTPLIFSIIENNEEAFLYLIDKGANIHLKADIRLDIEQDNISPLGVAVMKSRLKLIEHLLKQDVVISPEVFPLLLLAKKKVDILKLFIKYKVNFKEVISPYVKHFTSYGNINTQTTPLILAIKFKSLNLAKLLYDKSYLNYIEEITNKSALDYALLSKDKELILLLKKAGAKRACEQLKTKCSPLEIHK